MKIAIFTRAYITHAIGGIPSVCSSLAEGLVKQGHNVHVITTGHVVGRAAGASGEEHLNGVTIHYVACKPMAYTPEWYTGAHKKFIEIGGFDIAYSESGANHPFVDKLGVPTFARLHGVSFEEIINHLNLIYLRGQLLPDDHIFLKGKVEQYFKDIEVLKKYDHLITISDESRRVIRHRFFHPRVHRIYNGIDLDFFKPNPSAIRKLRFVAAGHNDPRKGFDIIRRAFDRAKRERPDIELVLAHNLTRDALLELYQTSWAFIDASNHYTGMNTTCIEAMACGLPIICSDLENFREMTNEMQTYIPLGDVEAMAKAIVAMCDVDTANYFSAISNSLRDRYDNELNVKNHIYLFKEALNA